MEFEQRFTIPVPAGQAWDVLLDVERIAPCMPGATLEEVEGDEFRGKVKVKVGPMTVTYRGTARVAERDEEARRAVIEASGKEARGPGTARATICGTLEPKGGETAVRVHTDLAVTGRPAQFGRGVMADVADKLLGRFADCLADELGREQTPLTGAGEQPKRPDAGREAVATGAAAVGDRLERRPAEAIDLVDVAGGPMLRRAGPLLAAVAALVVAVWWWRRRR